MIEFISNLNVLESTLYLWLLFIPATFLIKKHKEGELNEAQTFIGKCYLGFFVVLDVLYNFTHGSILLADPPILEKGKLTFTAHLKDVLGRSDNEFMDQWWRKPVATFICRFMLNPFDEGHCE